MGINALLELIETLRGENGCPWDKKQTPSTLAIYLVEELYELIDAIESGNPDDVCEELGDVLFHILFITHLYRERGLFDIKDVAAVTCEKMIRRHPHVFGNEKVAGVEAVREQWYKIKRKEKKRVFKASILDSVPTKLPALMRAYRISERAAKAGFDWDDMTGVIGKVEEEWDELKSVLTRDDQAGRNQEHAALEFGDILFTLVNVARFARIHPETALAASTTKFEKRFKYMEKMISENHQNIEAVSQQELEILWKKAKKAVG
ncbi:MAG: nucleoside triphosphate pyrophosphohydrolase [Pseudomonadota bacterium]|uniref:Nucleoside triphosphate pyrophosphohydrolase n=1 Tax=Candidatus Desulfatibia profunda TaxID=2841695 RepID=A0A8J6NRH8_9BACT|nr:nucleoside triphosphate pyrophosphohydrolase [Candidatus Desulfatibia profunda]MBL7179420.1 nucleoside triphosphate pyrophosphohydrolase [Desulfobacterales bacterium]MBU0698623.1 nucleoside triphosphate pyrophosphohydrolase [Pseudomonadota bacterium]